MSILCCYWRKGTDRNFHSANNRKVPSASGFEADGVPEVQSDDRMSNKKITVMLLVWVTGLLFLAQNSAGDSTVPPVKKSRSGICHDILSPAYTRTLNYDSFDTLDACLASGGRLAKNRMRPQELAPPRFDGHKVERTSDRVVVGVLAGITIVVGGYIWWRRRSDARATDQRRLTLGQAHGDFERRILEPQEPVSNEGYVFQAPLAPLAPQQDDLERTQREEDTKSSDEGDVFKRRYHRWDPWLNKIGYFDKRKRRAGPK